MFPHNRIFLFCCLLPSVFANSEYSHGKCQDYLPNYLVHAFDANKQQPQWQPPSAMATMTAAPTNLNFPIGIHFDRALMRSHCQYIHDKRLISDAVTLIDNMRWHTRATTQYEHIVFDSIAVHTTKSMLIEFYGSFVGAKVIKMNLKKNGFVCCRCLFNSA